MSGLDQQGALRDAQEGPTPRPRCRQSEADCEPPARKPRGPLSHSPAACARADGSAASASL
eukprot:5011488-Prymnesium_polylepis.1